MIISADIENSFDKIHNPFKKKKKQKQKTKNQEYKLGIELGTERNFLKLLKGIYEEL